MIDIRTKPVTPEYEEAWERVFGKNQSDIEKECDYIHEKLKAEGVESVTA